MERSLPQGRRDARSRRSDSSITPGRRGSQSMAPGPKRFAADGWRLAKFPIYAAIPSAKLSKETHMMMEPANADLS
jgi:hypothetical protein